MPVYEYYCPANHRTVEVIHGMSTQLQTWGQLCSACDEQLGTTHADEPVEKLLSAGMVVTRSTPGPMDCARPGGCCGGGCSM